MGQSSSLPLLERLAEQLTSGTERLLRDVESDASDETLATTATELRDVLEELDDLLGTIDLEKLPDVVEVSALPDLLDLDELPDAIHETDPDAALDLRALRRAVKLRELWNTVDLVDFQTESQQFEAELEDVVGPDAFDSTADSEAAAELETVTEEVKGDATNAAIQQEVHERIETARNGSKRGRRGTLEIRSAVRIDSARTRVRRSTASVEQSDGGLVSSPRSASGERVHEGLDRPDERSAREDRRVSADLQSPLEDRI